MGLKPYVLEEKMKKLRHRDKRWKRMERKRKAKERAKRHMARIRSYGIEWVEFTEERSKKER